MTFFPLAVHLPWVDVAETKSTSLGRASVTTTPVAASGPRFSTWIV